VPEPQSAIIPEPSENALFLVLGVNDPSRNRNAVARALANVPAITRTVGAIDAKARLVSAAAVGSELWDVLSPKRRPAGLRPLTAIPVDGLSAPATGGDLLVHIISRRHDLNFELATRGDNGAPGVRKEYHPNYYGAFIIDPDGNNIEAVCHNPA